MRGSTRRPRHADRHSPGKHLRVAWTPVDGDVPSPIDPWDDALVHARELHEAKELFAEHGIVAEYLEPSGDPARTIERIAEEDLTKEWAVRAVPPAQTRSLGTSGSGLVEGRFTPEDVAYGR